MRDLRYTLDTLMSAKKQEEFARLMGWKDVAQMLYYEEMAEREYLLQVQGLPDAPSFASTNTHELEKVDPSEYYSDSMAGVY